MKWRLPDWRSVRAFMRLRLAALASSANAQLAKVLRPKVARALAVLFFFSIIAVAAHAASATSAGAVLVAPPNDLNLAGYWPFDSVSGTMTPDMSGNGNNGTTVGSPTLVSGKIGQALSFNGTSQYVTGPTFSHYGITNQMTVSAWVKPTATQSNANWYGIVAQGNFGKGSDSSFFMVQKLNSTNIYFSVFTGPSTAASAVSATSMVVGKWYHVVETYDGSFLRVYVNGVLDATPQPLSGNVESSTDGLRIGTNYQQGGIDGDIDEVRIYNRALSAADVEQLYQQGVAIHDSSPTNLLTNGLVGYWTFDGQNTNWNTDTTADVSGKGNTGKLINMSTTTSPVLGRFGQALSFNGSNTVSIPNSSNLSPTASITLSAWVNARSLSAGYETIIGKGHDATYEIDTGSGTNTLRFVLMNNVPSAFIYIAVSNVLSLNKWIFVTATYNGVTAYLYVNGVLVGSDSASGTIATTAYPVTIGSGDNNFHGSIDDVRIYNRALSATEVAQLYDAGAIGATIDTAPAQALSGGGLVGYWPFDGNKMNWASSLALDASGNDNNGALVNMTTANAVMGVIGQALSFNGTSQYVDAGQASSLGLTNAITVSVWAKPSVGFATNGGWNDLVGKDTAGYDNTSAFSLFQTWGQPNFNFKVDIGSNQYSVPANTTFVANRWYQIVGTYDGSYLRFYTNGVLDSTPVAARGNINSTTQHLLIGVGRLSYSEYFKGTLDDVRIYNRALSATEVKQLYNLGR